MKSLKALVLSGVLFAALLSCTPKTTQPTQDSTTTDPPSEKPVVNNEACATFSDSKAGEAALDAHVIYRDFMKREEYAQALPYWRQAFKAAPAADGQRTTHFDDGVKLYDHLLNQQSTTELKRVYLDSILYIYDWMNQCYPENSYADGRKAFDLYYNYRDLVDNQTIFQYFTKVLDKKGLDAPAFVINPFTALLVEMFSAKQIEQPIAVKYAQQVLDITEKQADNSKDGWPIVLGYAPAQLDVFETVKGFYDCEYYRHKYYESVNMDSVSCDELPIIRSFLLWGDCPNNDPAIAAVEEEYLKRCVVTETGPLAQAREALDAGRYSEAIRLYKEYVASIQDPAKRAQYNLRIAKIYYAHLKNFQQAREFARAALRDRPNMGEAYIVIGKLYASSGPLCGPGRGWESQIVTWPAIDMFVKARQVDSSVASEANRLINTYSKYMPSVEDIFQRQLSEGQSFFVGCWIQESTTIRAARA